MKKQDFDEKEIAIIKKSIKDARDGRIIPLNLEKGWSLDENYSIDATDFPIEKVYYAKEIIETLRKKLIEDIHAYCEDEKKIAQDLVEIVDKRFGVKE